MEEALREQAQSLPAHIRWQFTGALSNQDVLRFYQENAVDLFINVSASEGLPVSIMEAMSFGIPVAATDVGGVGELVRPGANGFLWPADVTPDTIADTIHHFFLLSETQKKAMREAAWQTWRDRVNAEVQYPEFAQQLLALT
jgi:glycosyltransferase involved in cell wall biosynthesis